MIAESQKEKLLVLAKQARPTIKLSDDHIGAKEIIDISIALDRYELVKIVLPIKSKTEPKAVLNAVCALTEAEPISVDRCEITADRHSPCLQMHVI